MKTAIVLYDRFTVLDAVGPYQVLSAVPDAETVFVAERTGPVRDDRGSLALVADATLADVPRPDVIVVPGGPGSADQVGNETLHEWLREADRTSTWTTSVCTGSVVLAAAGLLEGRPATTHWAAMERLAALGAMPVPGRTIVDDKYVTAAGVSAGIDMALALAGRLAGDRVAQSIQLLIEYDPRPPYRAGSPDQAPPEVLREFLDRRRGLAPSR